MEYPAGPSGVLPSQSDVATQGLLAHTRFRHVEEHIAQAVGAAVRALHQQNRDQSVPWVDPALSAERAAVAVRPPAMSGEFAQRIGPPFPCQPVVGATHPSYRVN